jgi:UDP-N-acetylglucosamine--N-acetylmuramyl-(pentapeptide) pyrophosphoryl-undecaprenol N-acetylglucosamine transferase
MSGLVVLAAGGTGGHLFPAEALARELLTRGRNVALVTDRRGGTFPVEGVPTYRVPAGTTGPGLWAKLRAVIEIGRGTLVARALLKRLGARAVIGFGGYPSLPTMLAATHLGLPTAVHEQNAVLGRANRLLARRVARIATAFGSVEGLESGDDAKIVRTGIPVRPGILALRTSPYRTPAPGGEIRLLVVGGSLGARILSRIVPAALMALPVALRARLVVSQQVRAEDADAVAAVYAGAPFPVDARPFFKDMPDRLAAAHLVIGRAGGSTIAELTVAGRPAILVPFAAAIADEQTANARILVGAGAAWLLAEPEFTAEALTTLLTDLFGAPEKLAAVAAAAHALGEPEAAAKLADLVETLTAEARP